MTARSDTTEPTLGLIPGGISPTAEPNTTPEVAKATRAQIPGFEWARATHMRDAVTPMMARYRLAAAFPGAIHEPTGIAELDRVVPFAPGRLIVIAGRQGAGKSALSLQIARFVSGRGPVLYLLTEMSLEQVVTRTVASTAHIDANQLEKGASKATLAEAKRALKWLAAKANLTHVEIQGGNANKVTAGIRTWHKANPTARMVIVDNLWGLAQTMQLGDSSGIVSQRLGKVANDLASLSVELGIPIVLVHHLNREGAPSGGRAKNPDASMLGGSDHIGNWASSILILQRDSRAKATTNGQQSPFTFEGTHKLFIAKNRDGLDQLDLNLAFIGSQMRFEGIAGAEQYSIAPREDARSRRYRAKVEKLPEW